MEMWHKNNIFFFWVIFMVTLNIVNAHLMEGLYCGVANCYDVLGLPRDTNRSDIAKTYRLLARQHHPDQKTGDVEKFKEVANAYEILKDEESRTDYDYMLDNPDAYYQNYYRYYRRKGTKVDIRFVLITSITIISFVQYFVKKQKYESAIKYFVTVPKYRNKALEMISQDKNQPDIKKDAKNKKINKTEAKEQQEKVIRQIIEENMDIKGSYSRPDIKDVLWVQLIICPYTISKFIYWHAMWYVNFNILGKEYGDEEKLYMLRKNLGMGENQFNALEEYEIENHLRDELWDKEKYKLFKNSKDEEMKLKMAESSRYKSHRRYMKNNKSRMTFDD